MHQRNVTLVNKVFSISGFVQSC